MRNHSLKPTKKLNPGGIEDISTSTESDEQLKQGGIEEWKEGNKTMQGGIEDFSRIRLDEQTSLKPEIKYLNG